MAGLLASLLILSCARVESLMAPRPQVWERWQNHDPESTVALDFEPWAEFLRRYVVVTADGRNIVRYADVSEPDRINLERFVAHQGRVAVGTLDLDTQAAFWINLYNALTARLILQHYPVRSILEIDISPSPLSDGPFDASLLVVDGTPVTLNDIQHRILRPIWQDARMHYALSNGSRGGPDLAPRPYVPGRLDLMLDLAARGYVNDPRGVRLAPNSLSVSRLYAWYAGDFDAEPGGLPEHLVAYADADLAQRIRASADLQPADYDWRLNDAAMER